jgi:hypothetical protein
MPFVLIDASSKQTLTRCVENDPPREARDGAPEVGRASRDLLVKRESSGEPFFSSDIAAEEGVHTALAFVKAGPWPVCSFSPLAADSGDPDLIFVFVTS